jgi:zinc protease
MGFGILKEIIQTAELDPQEIEKEKKIIISEIKKRRDNTYARAVDLCESALFLPDAYGFSVFGCENSLKNISRDDLIDWKDKLFSSSDILLSVSGDTNIQEIKSLAETIYVNNKKNGLKCDNLISDKKRIIKKNEYICKKQAVVAIGYKTSKIKSKDFAGLEVLNNVLSGMGSRLFIRVRDDLGLAYTISSVYHAYFRSGSFMIYFGTSHEKYSKAIDVIFKELEILKKNVIDTDELKRSINYLLGTRHIDMQKNASRAFKYAVYELSGYGWQTAYNIENKFKNVSIKEIKRVAEKYFDLKNCVIAKILPEKK